MAQKQYRYGFIIDGNAEGAVKATKATTREFENLNKEKRKGSTYAKQYTKDISGVNRSLGDMKTMAAGALTALGGFAAFTAFKDINREAETLRGSLVTITGDVARAALAFDKLEQFASKTPYTLDQSIQGFIKLSALGLTPSERALASYGNTAAAMGKDMMQMIEAVADASTGEFERLKEFGIKAKTEGDNVSFTFQGVTTTVKKNASEIEEYLLKIGENKFGDAMANQMERLPGQLSNLEDSVGRFWRSVGDSGATEAFGEGVKSMSGWLNDLSDNIDIVTDGALRLAKIAAVGGALYVAMAAAPVVMGVAATAARTLGQGIAFTSMAYAAGIGPIGMFTASLGTSVAMTKAAIVQAGLLKTAFGLLFAAFAGWEFGSWLRNFTEVRVAALAFVGATLTGIETLKHGWAVMSAHISAKWDEALRAVTEKYAGFLEWVAGALDKVGADETAASLDSYAKSLTKGEKAGDSLEKTLKALEKKHKSNVKAIDDNIISLIKYELSQKKAKESTKESTETLEELGKVSDGVATTSATVSDDVAKSWEKASERIDTAFADAWKGAFDSFSDFADQIKNALKQLMAELIHQATTKKILISLGLGGSGSAFASGGSGINAGDIIGAVKNGFSLTDLMQGGGFLAGANGALMRGVGHSAQFLADMGFAGAAESLSTAAAYTASLPGGLIGGGLITAGAGYLGGQAGNAIGEGLFGKEAEHSYGQIAGGTIGGLAGAASGAVLGMQMGAWAGPVGALIGAALGALADVAFGGDGKKRVSLGVHAADLHGGRYLKDTEIAASGLELTSMSRRVGGDGDKAARTMLDAFLLMDQSMVAAAETLGQSVDLGGVALKGKSGDAGHADGAFFGSAAYNRVDQNQIDEAAGEFVTAWSDAVGGKFDETMDTLTAGLSMKDISDHAGGIISAVGLVGSATGDLKLVLDRFVPTLDDTEQVASGLPFWFGQLNKTVSAFPFKDLIQEGEVAATTLTRLSINLVGANDVIGKIGMRVLDLDEAGIRAADTLTGLFGGVDAFAAAANNYATAFMTGSERFVVFQDGMQKTFVELNAQLPETRREFQAMVESLDLADEAAQKQFAAYMALVPVMDEYFQALEQHQDIIANLESGIGSLIDRLYGAGSDIEQRIAEEKARIAEQQKAADSLYRTEQKRYSDALAAERRLSEYVDSLQLGELSILTPTQQLAAARAQFEAAVDAAKGGDAGAAQDATKIAGDYLKIARDFYASSGDYRDIFLGVNQELGGLSSLFGGASEPAKTAVGDSDTLADLYSELEALRAQEASESRQLDAAELATALGDLGLAKDVSVGTLMESLGIDIDDLAKDFGLNIEALSLDTVGKIADLAGLMETSSIDLLDLLGTSFADLADDLGIDIQNLNESSAQQLVALGSTLNLTNGELLGNLGLKIDGLDGNMKSELEALGKALGGLSNLQLLEGMGQDLAGLAESFGVDLGSLDTSMTDELRALGDVFNLAIGSLAEELDINLAVLPVAVQEAIGYEAPPEPESPSYSYDTWSDWLANYDANNADFVAAYQDWFAENNPLSGWSWGGFYAKGGIANEPSIFGEAGPEAAVPLPDGRTIPVTLSAPPSVASDKLVQSVDELKAEVKQLREENAAIAEGAALQREDAKSQASEDADRINRTLKRDVNTRAVA